MTNAQISEFVLEKGYTTYFTLQEVRFFPFHYPNAVALLFYGSLSHYRLYIIAWTGAAAFLVSRVAARFGSGDALALGGYTLAMAAAFPEFMLTASTLPIRLPAAKFRGSSKSATLPCPRCNRSWMSLPAF